MINDEGLIKKSAVLKLLKNLKENRPYANLDTTLDVAAVNVRKMPTADVVEVVRCKDCRFNVANMEVDPLDITDYSDIVCSYFMTDGLENDDYCSYGKKVE